ncbi:MAG: hypothetical protein JXR07_07455 [Reichenbachiella sp.]
MEFRQTIFWRRPVLLLLITTALYAIFYQFHVPLNYESCELCDRHQYKKIYDYFDAGFISQIKFPFYTRPLIPLLASWVPALDIVYSFHLLNFLFTLFGAAMLLHLWNELKIPRTIIGIGFFWLFFHWTGIIRYNLMDYVTVDVALYLIHALALFLFIKKKYGLFYFLTPLAILVKDSFIPVMILFIVVNIYHNRINWFKESKHLIFPLILGIVFQKLILWLMPEQMDQKSSLMALLYHIKLALDNPFRFVRWFAAIGSAFGVFPALIVYRFRWKNYLNLLPMTLGITSLMFIVFGLTAGEDMTRIIFLGFPFIMTLVLLILKNERLPIIIGALLLSIPFMHLYPLHVDVKWAVDYASQNFVFKWAGIYIITLILFFIIVAFSDKKAKSDI